MASSPNTPSRATPGRSAFCTARQLGDVTRWSNWSATVCGAPTTSDMLNASIAMLPMLTRTDAIAQVNERVARLEAELVEQAKWREHPNRDTPEHVRDQPNCGRDARTELEWAKSLSKRLSEGAYTMADDPGSWRTVPDHLKMRF